MLDRFETLPLTFVRFESPKALLDTVNAADVTGVRVNERFHTETVPVNSLPQIRQPEAAAAGFTGAGHLRRGARHGRPVPQGRLRLHDAR